MKTIFVSSTFRDMNYERDAIHHKVAPALNAIAHKYGDHIVFRDLRWGVDTSELDSDAGEKKVLRFCLDEIDSCKPYMIVLLGDRYGWMPENMDLVEDVIADRPNFSLPRNQDNHLERISVTALEIEYGILSNLVPMHHSLFYFRKIEGTTPKKYEEDYSTEKGEEYNGKLPNLRDSITSTHEYKPYNLRWEKDELVGLDEFVTMVTEDIRKLMEPEWEKLEELRKETEKLTEEERIRKLDQRIQWEMAHLKEKMFAARDDLVSHYVSLLDEGTNLFAIQGASRTGKTTLMSRLAVVLKEQGYGVLPLFAGLTSQTGTAFDILRYIVDYISSALNLTFDDDNYDTRSVFEKWETRLSEAIAYWNDQAKTRMVILVDAVDQLCADEWRDRLSFIPTNLSNKVQLVFSCLDSFELSQKIHVEFVPSLDNTMKGEVVWGILHFLNRQLSKEVVDVIIHKQNANNPLYLSLLVQRLLMMNRIDFEIISAQNGNQMVAISNRQIELLNMCSDDVEGLSADIIDVASSYIGKDFVKTALRYIAVSRHGLREQDLESILLAQGIKWNSLDFVLFTNFLGNFFIQREDGRYDFSHRLIREGCMREIYEEEIRPLHMHILAHLKTLDFDDPVCQQEIVWHTIQAKDARFLVEYVSKMTEFENSSSIRRLAQKDIFNSFIEENGEWLGELFKNIKIDNTDTSKNHFSLGNKLLNWFSESLNHQSINKYSYDEVRALTVFLLNNDNFSNDDFRYNKIEELRYLLIIYEANLSITKEILSRNCTLDNQLLLLDSYLACLRIYKNLNVRSDVAVKKMEDMLNSAFGLINYLGNTNFSIQLKEKILELYLVEFESILILNKQNWVGDWIFAKNDNAEEVIDVSNRLIKLAQSVFEENPTRKNGTTLLDIVIKITGIKFRKLHCNLILNINENSNNALIKSAISFLEATIMEVKDILSDDIPIGKYTLSKAYETLANGYNLIDSNMALGRIQTAMALLESIPKTKSNYQVMFHEASMWRSCAQIYNSMGCKENVAKIQNCYLQAIDFCKLLAVKTKRNAYYLFIIICYLEIAVILSDNALYHQAKGFCEKALHFADENDFDTFVKPIWCALFNINQGWINEINESIENTNIINEKMQLNHKRMKLIEESNKIERIGNELGVDFEGFDQKEIKELVNYEIRVCWGDL